MTLATVTVSDWVAILTAVAAVIAALAAPIAAWHGQKNSAALKPPSNAVKAGGLLENQAVNLSTLVHMVADEFGKKVQVPTPQQTQANAPGATTSSPPPLPVDKVPLAPAPPAPPVAPPAG